MKNITESTHRSAFDLWESDYPLATADNIASEVIGRLERVDGTETNYILAKLAFFQIRDFLDVQEKPERAERAFLLSEIYMDKCKSLGGTLLGMQRVHDKLKAFLPFEWVLERQTIKVRKAQDELNAHIKNAISTLEHEIGAELLALNGEGENYFNLTAIISPNK